MTVWSDKTLYDRIFDRWTEKDNDYARVNRNRKTITRYFRSDEVVETDDKGNLVGQNIYNGSGSWYSRQMATGFQGSMTSKNTDWIRHAMEEIKLRGVDQLDIWTQDITEYMTTVYLKSNFYDIQPQFTHDGITTGSPVIFGEEDILKERTMWMPMHFSKTRVYYDKWNVEEGVIIKDDTWTAKQIVDTFAKNDPAKRKKKLSVAVNTAYEQGTLEETFTVYRATFKVGDPIWEGFKKPKGSFAWLSVYMLELSDAKDSDRKNDALNDNIGYFSQPFSVWNFDKKPWESSSRTPAHYAIWDCMSLQQIDKNAHENMQLKNRPPTYSPNSMEGRLKLSPEGQMFVSDAEYDRPPKPVDMIGDITLNMEFVDIKVEALKRWFWIDKFQMFTDLAAANKAPVAAIHIWQLAGEKATLLSPAIETHSSYLETIDNRMMDIEIQAGRGPFDKRTLENITDIIVSTLDRPVSKVSVKPVFIGQLAKAQKVSQTLQPIQTTLDALNPLIGMFPQLRHKYREYELADKIENALDFPQDVVVPKDEYDEKVRAEAEAIAQQQQFENNVEMAKASKSISGKVEPDSVLATVAGAQG